MNLDAMILNAIESHGQTTLKDSANVPLDDVIVCKRTYAIKMNKGVFDVDVRYTIDANGKAYLKNGHTPCIGWVPSKEPKKRASKKTFDKLMAMTTDVFSVIDNSAKSA